jgi:Transposase DDE domain
LAFLQTPNANAEQIAAMAASCDVEVSKQAIEKRFTLKFARFLESLFKKATAQVVQSDQALAPILERFAAVNVGDSSSIVLPDSEQLRYPGRGGTNDFGKSAMKLQTEVELRTGRLECVEIEAGKDPDVSCSRQSTKRVAGTLRIADLGYFSIAVFTALSNAGAWFLSRIQRTTTIWIEGKRIGNVIDYLVLQELHVVDCCIEIGTKVRLQCRLIAWKVPSAIADERRRKLNLAQKKRGRPAPNHAALQACDWTFLVTNLPADKLTIQEAVVLYRARWQIELLFKRWKSIGLVGLLDGKNDATKLVRLWARLCAALIQHWLTVLCGWRSGGLISFARIAKLIPSIVEQIADCLSLAIREQNSGLHRILQRFYNKTSKSARRDKRNKPGTIELLINPEKLDYSLS